MDERKEQIEGGISILAILKDNIYHTIRRAYYVTFKKDYIRDSLAKRKGACSSPSKCNCCYEHPRLFTTCKHASLDGCLLKLQEKDFYEHCARYPFDEKDKSIYAKRHNCSFYWEDAK